MMKVNNSISDNLVKKNLFKEQVRDDFEKILVEEKSIFPNFQFGFGTSNETLKTFSPEYGKYAKSPDSPSAYLNLTSPLGLVNFMQPQFPTPILMENYENFDNLDNMSKFKEKKKKEEKTIKIETRRSRQDTPLKISPVMNERTTRKQKNNFILPNFSQVTEKVSKKSIYELFNGRSPISPTNVIKHINGFTREPLPDETHPGGKDNNRCRLPTQVLQLLLDFLPSSCDPRDLKLKCILIGYNRKGDKKILSELSERYFTFRRDVNNIKGWYCEFDNLVCRYSSHSNGGKLCLRFVLCDQEEREILFLDSHNFVTITKRGLEKKMERKRKRKNQDTSETTASVSSVFPKCGIANGGQIVKVFVDGVEFVNLGTLRVEFGNTPCNEIFCFKRNVIIVETPRQLVGDVDVRVSLDGVSYLKSDAKFSFVDPKHKLGQQMIIKESMILNGDSY